MNNSSISPSDAQIKGSQTLVTDKIPITVVVPIKNEAANLPGCLKSLGDFQEVIVVDSDSADGSVGIATDYGAKVLNFLWNGHFPKKRNWVLRTYEFQTEWVLFLDADEQVTPEFIAEISAIAKQSKCNGYWVTYHNYFMGQLLRHGDKFRKLPLLRLGHGEFERIEEDSWSKLDMEVHEHLIVDGEIGHMKSALLHNDFKGLLAYYDRHNHYSSWEAARFLSLQKDSYQAMNKRQRLKYHLLGSIFFPPLYFLGTFILKGGFLDGKAGLRFAIGKMFYFYQINFKIKEKSKKEL